jgi:UDP-N-acetylmuramoyl-tripeptide--D-alanyl-D-alanine ligase
MAMRGAGQIAELAAIAEPDVAVIVSLGPVHLELLGTIEAIAAAKAELIAGLKPGGTAIVPANEPLLTPHLRSDVHTITFGNHGDVQLRRSDPETVEIDHKGETIVLEVPFIQAHLRRNLLPAVAAARAVGVIPSGPVALELTPGRGQHLAMPGGVTLIDGCYNANPMSMRAALEDLADTAERTPGARAVAVLGDMLELGPTARDYHLDLAEEATRAGVEVLVTVGPLAAAIGERFDGEVHTADDAPAAAKLIPELIRPGDLVLVKGSLGVGLAEVCRALTDAGAPAGTRA